MMKNTILHENLHYLYNTPKKVNFRVVAGPTPHPIQMYDLIYDDYDLKIRRGEVKL